MLVEKLWFWKVDPDEVLKTIYNNADANDQEESEYEEESEEDYTAIDDPQKLL